MKEGPILQPHGATATSRRNHFSEIVYDASVAFCARLIDRESRTTDQMVQAARSGKQNIAEGSMASGISKKMEIMLVGVARASLEELLLDYGDFLRQRDLQQWPKDHEKAVFIRKLAYRKDKSYKTYIEEKTPETAANTAICVIHQANYLLDKLKSSLEAAFLKKGGFSKNLYRARRNAPRSGKT